MLLNRLTEIVAAEFYVRFPASASIVFEFNLQKLLPGVKWPIASEMSHPGRRVGILPGRYLYRWSDFGQVFDLVDGDYALHCWALEGGLHHA